MSSLPGAPDHLPALARGHRERAGGAGPGSRGPGSQPGGGGVVARAAVRSAGPDERKARWRCSRARTRPSTSTGSAQRRALPRRQPRPPAGPRVGSRPPSQLAPYLDHGPSPAVDPDYYASPYIYAKTTNSRAVRLSWQR